MCAWLAAIVSGCSICSPRGRTGFAAHYLNQNVRKMSDPVARVAAFPIGDDALAKSLQGKQREMSRYRQTVAHLVENGEAAPVAIAPPRRQAWKGG